MQTGIHDVISVLYYIVYIDGRKSKLTVCILAVIQERQTTSTFSYFAPYSLHDKT